jgi:hypothetical protein
LFTCPLLFLPRSLARANPSSLASKPRGGYQEQLRRSDPKNDDDESTTSATTGENLFKPLRPTTTTTTLMFQRTCLRSPCPSRSPAVDDDHGDLPSRGLLYSCLIRPQQRQRKEIVDGDEIDDAPSSEPSRAKAQCFSTFYSADVLRRIPMKMVMAALLSFPFDEKISLGLLLDRI